MTDEESPAVEKSTSAPTRDDPFELREGKALSWRNVTMKVAVKKGAPEKIILDRVWGAVPARETTAIMGPSGAGKTSLLNVLSGRVSTGAQVTVQADVRLENSLVDPTNIYVRKQIAFVSQDDSLMVSSTPRESLMFSAKLRLSKDTTKTELTALTNNMLKELGLESCADTLVGGGFLKGISGGEKKRTSVGVELVTKPTMVFLDEPTSGLDSFSAVQLCKVLKKVATSGASVMFTIHQPSSNIFESFDHLIFMSSGRIMYQGPVSIVDEYFASRGHALPPKYNPADWIMIVAQSIPEQELELQGFFESDPLAAIEAGPKYQGDNDVGQEKHVSFWVQLGLLTSRDLKNLKRDKQILGTRLILTSFTSILMGIIFWQVGKSDPSVVSNLQSHFGAQVMILMSSMFGTALPALIVFPRERPVFVREYSTNHYSIVSYFLSRLTMELFLTGIQMILLCTLSYYMIGFQLRFYWHFFITYALAMSSNALAVLIGSAVTDQGTAIEFLPMVIIPQLLFAGFFVQSDLIPIWLRWLQYVFPLTYAVRLHMHEEYSDCGDAQMSCDTLTKSVGVDPDLVWLYWLMLIGLLVLLRLVALVALKQKAAKFH